MKFVVISIPYHAHPLILPLIQIKRAKMKKLKMVKSSFLVHLFNKVLIAWSRSIYKVCKSIFLSIIHFIFSSNGVSSMLEWNEDWAEDFMNTSQPVKKVLDMHTTHGKGNPKPHFIFLLVRCIADGGCRFF